MRLFTFLFLFVFANTITAQTLSHDLGIRTQAQVINQDLLISWDQDTNATGYYLYRRNYQSLGWGPIFANLNTGEFSFLDTTVIPGQIYEYKLLRNGGSTGFGYTCATIDGDIDYNPGKLMLVLDDFFLPFLNVESTNLINDIEAEGWFVDTLIVNRNQTAVYVKQRIKSKYLTDPGSYKSVFLFGHIPVPYSGNLNPDGHPDHMGAWPADVFYADMMGSWSDFSVNNTSATDPRNHNVPGDGKFDPYVLQNDVQLQVARVDFYNLPGFPLSEIQLMQNYLDKLHQFKTRMYIPPDMALIEDNFLGMSEGFAGSAYLSLSPIVGIANTNDGDYSALVANDYLWSYGTGPGSYTSASGIVASNDFANQSFLSSFTMLFGSYFGDWDSQDNLLRSALASGRILTSSWSGRPFLYYHPMGIGRNIGTCIKLSQGNTSAYFSSNTGYFPRWVHIAQMGDPTLRSHYVEQPVNLSCTIQPNGAVALHWEAPIVSVDGYHVYRNDGDSNWIKLTGTPISSISYQDNGLQVGGTYEYMVRAVRPLVTGSGRYWNQSLGIRTICNSNAEVSPPNQGLHFLVGPNPFNEKLSIKANEPCSYQLFDAFGKSLSTGIIADELSLQTNFYKPGIYFLQLGTELIKLIKVN